MKTLIIGFFLFFLGCSSFIPAVTVRAFPDRLYKFDEYPFVKFRWCSKYKMLMPNKTKHCKEWSEDKIDISNPENFKKFKDANFILINEKSFFGS